MRAWPLVLVTLTLACSRPGVQSSLAPAVGPMLAPAEGDSLLITVHKVRADSAPAYEHFMTAQWYPAALRLAGKDPEFGPAFRRRWRLVSSEAGDDSLMTYFFVYPYIRPEGLSTWGIYRRSGASDAEVARDSARYATWVDHTEGYLVSRREYAPASRDSVLRLEVEAIRAQETRWREVIARRDTAAIGSFYTEDGVYGPDNAETAYHGRDAVRARWSQEFQISGFVLERTASRIDVASSADLAQEIGTYVVRLIRDGKPYEGHGNYMTAWRKDGGQWRIAGYIWNADKQGHDRMVATRRAE